MNEFSTSGWAAIAIAVVTAAVSLWTQRGGARARRRTAAVDERGQTVVEFETFMRWSETELREQREQISDLRGEVRSAQQTIMSRDRALDAAVDHIRLLRPLVPSPPGPPALPEILRVHVEDPFLTE